MKTAFVFPGQGSQFVGMGKDLAEAFREARDVFEMVDEALGQHLSRTMWEGPEDALNLTENTQPALMAVSMAVLQVLNRATGPMLGGDVSCVAGHSLGEYSAIASVGGIEVPHTARLLRLRGQAMQRAVPQGEGAMAAVLGLEIDALREIARKASEQAGSGKICACANDNAPGQIVLSGHADAVEIAGVLAKEAGAKRVVPLPVSVPSHCCLMAPAAKEMANALADTNFRPPMFPVITNVEASLETDPAALRRCLIEQITEPVRWRESVLLMEKEGIERIVELGAGKVLGGLTKRIAGSVESVSVGTPAQVDAFLEGFSGNGSGQRAAAH